LDIRQLTDVSACKLQQYLSRNWHFPSATRPRERSKLMASDRPVPYGIGSDTWPGLSRLAADAAQVARAAAAIISTGNDTAQDAAVQRENLQEQLGDLRAAIDYVIGKNALDWAAVNKRRDRKRSLYERGIDENQPPSPGQRDDDAAGSPSPAPHGHGAGDNGRPAPHQHARPSRPATRSARPRARAAAPGSSSSPD
jgi:hypothetical protein